MTIRNAIAEYYRRTGKPPDRDYLMKACGIDAKELHAAFLEMVSTGEMRRDGTGFILLKSAPFLQVEAAARSTVVKKNVLDFVLDNVALIVALAVDLVLNAICMIIIAPGPLEAVGFCAISIIVVLFGVRSWIKNNKLLWAMFALVAFFFDLSFVLVATDVQTQARTGVEVSASTDGELARLTRVADDDRAALSDLQAQYRDAGRRETMDQLQRQIDAARAALTAADVDRAARLRFIESGAAAETVAARRSTITAAMIFGAIPAAYTALRIIPLIVFALIFSGLQLVIITAATDMRRKQK